MFPVRVLSTIGSRPAPAQPGRPHRLAALLMAGIVLLGACGDATKTTAPSAPDASSPPGVTVGPSGSGTTTAPTPAGPPPDLKIPAAPAMAAVPAGTVDAQAAALAKAVLPGGQAALAPLLAAYRAAGIPVIGDDGHHLTGFADDQVGPGWWQVWLSAGGNPRITLSLADVTKALVAIRDAPSLDTGAVATAALADLRTMAAEKDPHRRFFARFIADLSAARSGVDLTAPTTTAADVRLDPIAVEFFMAGLVRSAAIAAVRANPGSVRIPTRQIASIGGPLPLELPASADAAPAGNPCNPSGDPEAVSFWTQWIASKLTGGLNLPGMDGAMKSAVELVVKNAELASKAGRAAAVLGGAIAALTFMLQMATLQVSIEVTPPLERTKDTTNPGKEAVITATLKYDLDGKSLDGGVGVKNCLLVFLNALGIQAALPADGAVEGAQLKFLGEEGFNQGVIDSGGFVTFPNGVQEITQSTGQGGIAKITVQGRAQKKRIPDSAAEWHRNATVRIFAQPEAENGRSLANTFWDSFVALGAGPIGAVAPIVDVLKGVMFDLGDYGFLVIDWQVGWTIKADAQAMKVNGTKCDSLDGEWVMQGNLNQGEIDSQEIFTITIPEGSMEGTFQFSGTTVVTTKLGVIVSTQNEKGHASIVLNKDGTVSMTLDAGMASGTATAAGHTEHVTVPMPAWQFTWQQGATGCDEAPP